MSDRLLSAQTASTATAPATPGRRALLRNLGIGAATAAAASGMGAAGDAIAQAVVSPNGVNDTNILRFAMNFEYLGAELYTRALTGNGLPANMIVGPRGQAAGMVTGGRQVTFSSSLIKAFIQQLANDEVNHVSLFRATLGNNAIARPTIDFAASFRTIAQMAGLGSNFDAFANETNLLLAAYSIEDVCVSALHGASTLITSKQILDTAAGLLAAESYQAGMIRTQLFIMGYANQTNAISALRTRLDGSAGTPTQGSDHGVGTMSAPTIVNADTQSIAGERTMNQVLRVAYGSTANPPAPGGFFPNGINTF